MKNKKIIADIESLMQRAITSSHQNNIIDRLLRHEDF